MKGTAFIALAAAWLFEACGGTTPTPSLSPTVAPTASPAPSASVQPLATEADLIFDPVLKEL